MKCVMINPPMKKPITATKEGFCRLLNPEIAWPDVHPPAYLVPKPTRKPAITKIDIPFKLRIASQLNISDGNKDSPTLSKPMAFKSSMVLGDNSMVEPSDKKLTVIKPPIMAPTTTTRFQRWDFQSYLKKSAYLPAPPILQSVLRLEDIPNVFPK